MATLAIPVPAEAPASVTIPESSTALGEILSPSQLRTWMDCQARWMFRYFYELPEPANSSLALGRSVHHALGLNFHQKVETGADLPTPEVVRAFCEAWKMEAEATAFAASEDAMEIGVQGAALVAAYMNECAATIQPAAVEIHVGDGDARIGGVRVQGVVDILDVDGRIIDLKTAKRSPSRIDHAQMIQLATYAAVTPGARGTVRIDTLVRGKPPKVKSFSGRLSASDFASIESLYPLAQEGMRSGLYMPNRTSMMCSRRNCGYWRQCEEHYGGVVEECA
ncbi:MAG: PD-(D/E)XK nuclease family protein [Fimbriimonadaceae bacterium]|nr:PD-(D/E)XK nuclease family protein [Fimbriimonadaceae bacterium]